MFDSAKTLNDEAITELNSCNQTLTKGINTINEGNDNIRTDEIVEKITDFKAEVDNLISAIESINSSIDTLNSDYNISRAIREKELAAQEMTYEDDTKQE